MVFVNMLITCTPHRTLRYGQRQQATCTQESCEEGYRTLANLHV